MSQESFQMSKWGWRNDEKLILRRKVMGFCSVEELTGFRGNWCLELECKLELGGYYSMMLGPGKNWEKFQLSSVNRGNNFIRLQEWQRNNSMTWHGIGIYCQTIRPSASFRLVLSYNLDEIIDLSVINQKHFCGWVPCISWWPHVILALSLHII